MYNTYDVQASTRSTKCKVFSLTTNSWRELKSRWKEILQGTSDFDSLVFCLTPFVSFLFLSFVSLLAPDRKFWSARYTGIYIRILYTPPISISLKEPGWASWPPNPQAPHSPLLVYACSSPSQFRYRNFSLPGLVSLSCQRHCFNFCHNRPGNDTVA